MGEIQLLGWIQDVAPETETLEIRSYAGPLKMGENKWVCLGLEL